MGKSVFLLPSPNAAFNRAQIRKLRDTIGDKQLLDGPFADKCGAVEELADLIRSRMKSGGHRVFDTILALSPKNLPSSMPPSSFLNIPFFLQNTPDDFDFRACAGEFAGLAPSWTDAGLVRKTSIDEIVVLAVSTIRMLGAESYFAMLAFKNSGKRPAVLIPGNTNLNVALLTPAHFQDISDSPISYLEVLDPDAVGSLLRIRAAYCMSELLMYSIIKRDSFHQFLESQAICAGHLLYEGKMMWSMEDSIYALESAVSMFGNLATKKIHSLRCDLQAQFIDVLENPNLLICEADPKGIAGRYYRLVSLLISHEHPLQLCNISPGKN